MNLIDEVIRLKEMLIFVRTKTDIPSDSAVYFLEAEKALIELGYELVETLKSKYNYFIEAEKEQSK